MAHGNKILLETGDALLLETGDYLLKNNEPDSFVNSPILPTAWIRWDDPEAHVDIFIADSSGVGVESVSSPTIEVKKYDGGWEPVSDGTWVELGFGWYDLQLDEDDCDTLGAMLVRANDGTNPTALRVCEVGLSADDVHSQYLRVRNFFKERK